MMNDTTKESAAFLVTNASGRHINLLNDNEAYSQQQQLQQQPVRPIYTSSNSNNSVVVPSPSLSEISDETNNSNNTNEAAAMSPTSSSSKRKYHCTEPGCTKSFTTSGHLARHNRIHTGEKNFPCLFPGCQSRFSRQDNMMQHYRTHMSPKSRRTQKKVISEDLHPRPRLHAHQRIRSDPYRVERPLTIDQHLNNYRRSLLSHPSTADRIGGNNSNSGSSSSVRYNMPTPLSSVAASHMQKHQQQLQQQQQQKQQGSYLTENGTWAIKPVGHQATFAIDDEEEDDDNRERSPTPASELLPTPSPPAPEVIFYQHKPLTFSAEVNNNVKSFLPFTLLHPTRVPSTTPSPPSHQFDLQPQQPQESTITPSLSSSSTASTATRTENNSSPSQAGLLQLVNIVSSFG
ncbi:unnamed protein product [Mucor hiemalis]